MLVLSRKKGESIIIDDQIEVTIVAVEGDVIKLGIEAPKEISILRKEIYQAVEEENRLAAQGMVDLQQILKLNQPEHDG